MNNRPLLPLKDVRDVVSDVDAGLDALCALLHKANAEIVHASHIYVLLKPLHERLSRASCDLNDMRL